MAEKDQTLPLREMYRYLAKLPYIAMHLKEIKRIVAWYIFWLVCCEITMVMQYYPVKYITEGIVAREGIRPLLQYGFYGLVLFLIGIGLNSVMDIYRNQFDELTKAVLRSQSKAQELGLPVVWHLQHGTGEKEAIIGRNLKKVTYLFAIVIFDALPVSFRAAFTSFGTLKIGWQFCALAIATIGVYTIALRLIQPKLIVMMKEYHDESKELDRWDSELTTMWRTIKNMGREREYAHEFYLENMRFYKDERWRHIKWRGYNVLPELIVGIATAGLFSLIAVLYCDTPIQMAAVIVGNVSLGVALMIRLFGNLFRLNEFQRQRHQGMQALDEIVRIFQTPNPMLEHNERRRLVRIEGAIEIKNLYFKYANGKIALSNLSLSIKPRKVLAVIGRSGSGKSTLASLLLREQDPTLGSIAIDGVDLRDLDLAWYLQNGVAVVSQTGGLFDGTIRDNIRASRPDAGPGEEEWAAELACVTDFTSSPDMPLGLDTQVGEGALRLSGGQKQRVLIARALHQKASLLILDEATSALDSESEEQVQTAINHLIEAGVCTMIIIAHRLSTIDRADEIAVMEDGRVVEYGTHSALMRKGGRYAAFRARQPRAEASAVGA